MICPIILKVSCAWWTLRFNENAISLFRSCHRHRQWTCLEATFSCLLQSLRTECLAFRKLMGDENHSILLPITIPHDTRFDWHRILLCCTDYSRPWTTSIKVKQPHIFLPSSTVIQRLFLTISTIYLRSDAKSLSSLVEMYRTFLDTIPTVLQHVRVFVNKGN